MNPHNTVFSVHRLIGRNFNDQDVQSDRRKFKKYISSNARAIRRLRTACERAKCTLSASSRTSIEIDSLFEVPEQKITTEFFGIKPAPKGVTKIEITFDIDEKSILIVSAVDKATGRSNKITITNDKGRLSKKEIERMASETEKYHAERKKIAQKMQARMIWNTMRNNLRNLVQRK
ncbi:unnamed protein product [Rhizophagus irregularis]|nr:unnamed protein product [Rhizophagus irregularis]